MKNNIQITSYSELLEFITREDVNFDIASRTVCTCLKVIPISFDTSKEKLIQDTRNYIKRWEHFNGKKPMFLNQQGVNFDIKDIV